MCLGLRSALSARQTLCLEFASPPSPICPFHVWTLGALSVPPERGGLMERAPVVPVPVPVPVHLLSCLVHGNYAH